MTIMTFDVPNDLANIMAAIPDKQAFLLNAIRREWQRRAAIQKLLQLSDKVSQRTALMAEDELQDFTST
ncbi:hypothetical protein [Thiothrix lacustris]|uniref:hypothetical protein n=1 Tax=Thiothrix lacustris TaxID=525917 RepID=UPI0027E55C5D|nr:hypothetical protein [Thiothrix lacustris]WMP17367.1 hypothetical protein RCS87_18565 [Thiothrix lacustris]